MGSPPSPGLRGEGGKGGEGLFLVAIAAALSAACRPVEGEEVGLLQGILWEYLLPLLGQSVLWTAVGGLAGALVAWLGYLTIKMLGLYECRGGLALAFRSFTGLLLVAIGAILGALAGFGEGLYRAERQILTTGVLARSVFPAVGSAGADLIAGLAWAAEVDAKIVLDRTAIAQLRARLEDYRQGRWKLEAERTFRLLDDLEAATIDRVIEPVRETAEAQFPAVAEGIGRQVLDFTLRELADLAMSEAVDQGLEATSLGDHTALLTTPARMVAALRELARQQGGILLHHDVGDAIVEWLVVKPLIQVLRPLVRANQVAALLILLGLVAISWLPFKIVAYVQRRFGRKDQSPKDPPLATVVP